MPSRTVEDYLKQLYLAHHGSDQPLVAMGRLAAGVGVTPGTATAMVKSLADAGLVAYEPRSGVRLTPAGDRLALQILRRHRLIELFLVEVLGLDWSEVHDEAEVLEHAISDKVLERIDVLLGHPDTDPHGDPIPPRHGPAPEPLQLNSLADCPTDQPLTVARITDQDPEFLRFIDRHGLIPGTAVVVQDRSDTGDAVTVQPDGRDSVTVGTSAARKIVVRDA